MLAFIVKQLPRRVRRDNEQQLERARECLMNEEFDTSEKLNELADALLWSIDVIPQNYRGAVCRWRSRRLFAYWTPGDM
jgi:hypothetical protein